MKVFLCKGSFFGPVSGADQMIVNYALQLKAHGHEPTVVITVPFAKDDQYRVRLERAGVPVKCIGRHPLYLLQLVQRKLALVFSSVAFLRKFQDWEPMLHRTAVFFLRWHRPDVLHIIAEGGLYIRAAHAARVPTLYQEPAMPFYAPNSPIQLTYEKLSRTLPLSSEVVGVSPVIAGLCRVRMDCPEHVSVVPILVEDPAPGYAPKHFAEIGVLTLGFAARLEVLKGPEVLIRAFAKVVQRDVRARLILAGSGEQETELRELVRSLGIEHACEFPGPYVTESEKTAFFESLDILVHPSLAEGTPCTVIEAMALGLPVIASDVGGVPDMLSAESGLLVTPNDVEALAQALYELAHDPERRAALGQAARARYLNLFAPQAVLPLLIEKYERIVARENGKDDLNAAHALHPWANVRA